MDKPAPPAPKPKSDRVAAVAPPRPVGQRTFKPNPGVLDGRGFSFFVAADTHFGFKEAADLNRRKIRSMNRLPGTPFPATLGGRVRKPLGVLVAGDLTNRGRWIEWKNFVIHYGLKGRDGLLAYPVFEGAGNHDNDGKRRFVANAIRKRHGDLSYGWQWHGVHFLCLGTHPRLVRRRWLRRQLRAAGSTAPIVIFFHYNIVGPYSHWWSQRAKRAFAKSLAGYNVLALFHGHYHASGHYRWKGFDVYNVGSPLHSSPSYAVVTITSQHLTVVSRNYEERRWKWRHQKRLRRGPSPAALPQ